MSDLDPSLLGPEMGDLEGEALLGEVRARIAAAVRGLHGAPYEQAVLALPEPMRVVRALDAFREALAGAGAASAIDRRLVTDAIEALIRVRLTIPALGLAEALGTARAVPAAVLEGHPALAVSMRGWNAALATYLEARRSFHQ